MYFAHFSHVWNKEGMTPTQRYQQLWRELELCDELGFDYGFSVEHHFRPDESWMTAPNLYTVAAGARSAFDDSALQRAFRDLTMAAKHEMINIDTSAQAYGRTLVGLDTHGFPL